MQDLQKIVIEVLKKDDRFVSQEGDLLKNTIRDQAEKLDENLIGLLLDNEKTREVFFIKIKDVIVFDSGKFIRFVNNKEFLPDSYTSFKNKIGLTNTRGEFLSDSNEVVLSFPYKDGVLAGGQDKEDSKRDEIFYNEILGSDDIDRLLDEKVFTNAKRIDKDGEHNIEKFTRDENGMIKDNFIIKGNNLLALHSLKSNFAGKVKLIYIDPPYNTGNDEFRYNDKFNHSTWLTFMKNRLEIAKDLLSQDGSIYVQIDNNEAHYLKVLMDDIFGRETFQRELIWVLKGVSGYKSLIKNYIRGHETILFYSKNKAFKFNKQYLPYSEEQLARFSSSGEDGRKYKVITKDRVLYLDEAKGLPISDVWDDIASFQTIVNSPEITGFSTQKPEKILERIISSSTDSGDIVLDYHLGSGTTCAVAHKMGRQYIGIEQMDYLDTISIPRLEKVIDGEKGGISKNMDWKGGGNFVYLELKKSNQEYIDKIQNSEKNEELMRIYEEIKESGFINYMIDINSIDENIDEFGKLSIEDQKKFLIELLDKNMLYVNMSEIDDTKNGVSDEEKKINRDFYNVK